MISGLSTFRIGPNWPCPPPLKSPTKQLPSTPSSVSIRSTPCSTSPENRPRSESSPVSGSVRRTTSILTSVIFHCGGSSILGSLAVTYYSHRVWIILERGGGGEGRGGSCRVRGELQNDGELAYKAYGKAHKSESGSCRRLGANLLVSAQVRPYTVNTEIGEVILLRVAQREAPVHNWGLSPRGFGVGVKSLMLTAYGAGMDRVL